MGAYGNIDLDILRGWTQSRDPQLRRAHALPALGRLVHLDSDHVERLHGPDLLVGRYHPQNGPVDLIPNGLKDHETYRLGAPHLHLQMASDGQWTLRHISPGTRTIVGDDLLEDCDETHRLNHGDELTLGCARYLFESSGVGLQQWEDERRALLDSAEGPALFLCRRGGPCGPRFALDEDSAVLLGRTIPPGGNFRVDVPWFGAEHKPVPPDVDLAGLYPSERKFISFLHAYFKRDAAESKGESCDESSDAYQVVPVSTRQKTFLNRHEIIEPARLADGDEVALGAVFFCVRLSDSSTAVTRKTIEPPAVVDWGEESSPSWDDSSGGSR
jgi:hypothetical protein